MSKFFKVILWLTISIIALIAIVLIGGKTLELSLKVGRFDQFLHTYKIGVSLWRYSFMAIFIAFYPQFIVFLYRNSHKSADVLRKLSQRRWAVIICVSYELVIVQNVLGYVVNLIIGGL